MRATIEMVPATQRSTLMMLTSTRGIVSISTVPVLSSLLGIPRILLVEVSLFTDAVVVFDVAFGIF